MAAAKKVSKRKTQSKTGLAKQVKELKASFDALLQQNNALADENNQLRAAKNNPVLTSQSSEYDESNIYQGSPNTIPNRGDARVEYETDRIVPAEHLSMEKAKLLKMNETYIKVRVSQTNDPKEVPIPEVQIDGIRQMFMRGHVQSVKVKYVLRLAELKRTTITQQPYQDENGDPAYRNIPHTALVYPFEIVEAPPEISAFINRVRDAS